MNKYLAIGTEGNVVLDEQDEIRLFDTPEDVLKYITEEAFLDPTSFTIIILAKGSAVYKLTRKEVPIQYDWNIQK